MTQFTRETARQKGLPIYGPLPPPVRPAPAPAPFLPFLSTRSGGLAVAPHIFHEKARRDDAASRLGRSWRFSRESRGITREDENNTCYQNSVQQAFMHQPPFLDWILTHNSAVGEAERRFGKKRLGNGRQRKVVKNKYRKRTAKKKIVEKEKTIEEEVEPEVEKDTEDEEERSDGGLSVNHCKRRGKKCFACVMKALVIRYWNAKNPPVNPLQWEDEVEAMAELTWADTQFPRFGQADANNFYTHCINEMSGCGPANTAA